MTRTSTTPAFGHHPAVWAALIFTVAFCLYLPKLGNNFTFDDRAFILDDLSLRSAAGVAGQFVTDQAGLYRPLRSAVLGSLIGLFGLDSAVPFHLAGLLLHALLSMLVFWIVWLILRRMPVAFVAGLIFALHPVHSGRVAFITASFDLLGLTFAYAAWAMALAYDQSGARKLLAGASLLLLVGCFAGEEAVVAWPLVVGSLFLLPKAAGSRRQLLIWLGLAVIAYLAARTLVLGDLGRTEQYAAGGLLNTIWTMPAVFWRYVGLALWPVGLSPSYAPTVYSLPGLMPLLGIAGLLGLAAVAVSCYRRHPGLALAIGWFLLALAPYGNLLPADNLMDERYLYAAIGGFAVAGGLLLSFVLRRRLHLAIVVFLALCLSYGAGTIYRCHVWGNPAVLWGQAAQREPDSFLANLNAAYHLTQNGRWEEGEKLAAIAHRLQPDRAEPLMILGNIALHHKKNDEAISLLKQATQADPQHCRAFSALAQALVSSGDFSQAALAAGRSLACNPHDPLAQYIAGFLLVKAGRCAEARSHLQAVIHTLPHPPQWQAAVDLWTHCQEKSQAHGQP